MNVFIFCTLMSCQLQISETIIRYRWQQQFQDLFQFEKLMNHVVKIPGLLYRPRQKKRIVSDSQEPLSPDTMRVQTRSSCSCESHYETMDLGNGHYPRYLPVVQCKQKTCQNKFHSCKTLHYMVYVLRSRESNASSADDDKLPEAFLPESLRRKWQLKPMTISVACVPA